MAVKTMPADSIIVGVDLVPIKPIKGCVGYESRRVPFPLDKTLPPLFMNAVSPPHLRAPLLCTCPPSIEADITTERCRMLLRKEIKHFKADVVLHDGAPNVGTSWIQDAFSQGLSGVA